MLSNDSIAIGRNMDHILLKGIKKNTGEFGLIYFTYNFRRVMNFFGFKEIIKRLKKLFFVLCPLWPQKGVNRAELFFQSYYRLPVLSV